MKARIKYADEHELILSGDFGDTSDLMGKDLDVSLKVHRERRSLDANGYMWALIGQIAATLQTSKEEVYHRALCDYGTFRLDDEGAAVWRILPHEESADVHLMPTKNKVRLQTKKGEKWGYVFIELKGSSEYNTKEMSTLIDGVVYEAKQLGIKTETENSIRQMMERYAQNFNHN